MLEQPLQIFFSYGERRIVYCRNDFLREDYLFFMPMDRLREIVAETPPSLKQIACVAPRVYKQKNPQGKGWDNYRKII